MTETGTHLTVQELIEQYNWELLEVEDSIIGVVSLSIKQSIRRGDIAYIEMLYIRRPFRPDEITQKILLDLLSLLKEKGFTRYEINAHQSFSLQFKKLTGTHPKEYRYWGRVPFVIHKLQEYSPETNGG